MLSFITSVYADIESGQEIFGMDYVLLPPEAQKAYAFKHFAIHITQEVLERYAEVTYGKAERSCAIKRFKAQGKEFLKQGIGLIKKNRT